jgi:hypothetical protein
LKREVVTVLLEGLTKILISSTIVIKPLKPSVKYMSHLLQQSVTSFCIYVFRMILTVNSDYFLKQRQLADLCNGEVLCFLCGTD